MEVIEFKLLISFELEMMERVVESASFELESTARQSTLVETKCDNARMADEGINLVTARLES